MRSRTRRRRGALEVSRRRRQMPLRSGNRDYWVFRSNRSVTVAAPLRRWGRDQRKRWIAVTERFERTISSRGPAAGYYQIGDGQDREPGDARDQSGAHAVDPPGGGKDRDHGSGSQ